MKSVEEWAEDLATKPYCGKYTTSRTIIKAIQADARAQGWADALEAAALEVVKRCGANKYTKPNGLPFRPKISWVCKVIRALKPGAGKEKS